MSGSAPCEVLDCKGLARANPRSANASPSPTYGAVSGLSFNELLCRPAQSRIKILHDPYVGLSFTQGDDDAPAVGAHAAR